MKIPKDTGVKKVITSYLGAGLHEICKNFPEKFFDEIEEIKIRVDKPLMIYRRHKEYIVTKDGQFTHDVDRGYKPTAEDVSGTLGLMSDYSLYAFEEELRMGYITLPGGHRVGVTGKTVLEKNTVRTIKNINGLNIRISHEMKGCGKEVARMIALPELMHTMIISPPACGKTTMLRDVIRLLSNGVTGEYPGRTIGVVDERSELAGCYCGVAQNDVGSRTDVLDGCPKAEGMIMLLRAMAPQIIAVDEMGSMEDVKAIEDIVNAGVILLCTVHGRDIEDVRKKPALGPLTSERIFHRYVVLSGPGRLKGVYDGEGGRIDT